MPTPRTKRIAFSLALLVVMALVVSFSTTATAQYTQLNIASDVSGRALNTDPNLRNGWGLAFFSTGPFWVSDNDTGVATLYAHFRKLPLVVTVPVAPTNPFNGPVGSPTGIVANPTSGFVVSANGNSGPGIFLFDTIDGTISGWNPSVDFTHAIVAVDNSASFAVYTGLALGTVGNNTFLFAADANHNVIDVYDGSFNLVNSFTDPAPPAGLGVYGIQNINGQLYVTLATPVPLQGGAVDIFGTDGTLIQRLSTSGPGGHLEAPWGVALAPNNFGPASNKLLVGNVDDGHINILDPSSGAFLGQLKDVNGERITIGGLWSLAFGAGNVANGGTNQLFFTAGPVGYVHGVFGVILPPKR